MVYGNAFYNMNQIWSTHESNLKEKAATNIQIMKRAYVCAVPLLCILVSAGFPHVLVGTWMSAGTGNAKVLLEFKSTGAFRVTVDSNVENEGRYEFRNDTFTMYDNGCGSTVPGKYRINFLTADSAVFLLINDPCKGRAAEVDKGRISRINSRD